MDVHIDAKLASTCAAAMRPYVNLLWPLVGMHAFRRWHCLGSTLLEYTVYLIMNDGAVKSEGKSIEELVPFMDRDPQTTVAAAKMPSPRLMKTHMPYGCLPAAIEAGNAKVTSGLFSSCRRTRLLTLIALVDAQCDKLASVKRRPSQVASTRPPTVLCLSQLASDSSLSITQWARGSASRGFLCVSWNLFRASRTQL